jgi:actin-related protein 6
MSKNIIIDNGQYNLKFGSTAQDSPHVVPNCILRTQDKRVHLGSTISSQQSMRDLAILSGGLSNISFQRPIRNGQCFQWNLEHQIWDNAFVNSKVDSGNGDFLKDSNLLYIEAPITLPKFQNMTDQILFEEFEINSLVRNSAPALAPWLDSIDPTTGNIIEYSQNDLNYKNFQLVIDSGFDCTWIVPVIYGIPYYRAIRKLPIAGRFLNGYLREIVSFRHYNIVEEPILVDAIKRQTSYVALDFNSTLNKLTRLKKNPTQLINSDLSLSYVLPNNKTDFTGYPVHDISQLSKFEFSNIQKTLEKKNGFNNNDYDDDDDTYGISDSNAQSLLLTDERFMIPELLFRPQLSGIYKAGLIQTIKSSIDAVPGLMQPLLVNNIVCMGGTANIPGFSERIAKDLDSEVNVEIEAKISDYSHVCKDLGLLAWHAGKSFFAKGGFEKIMMSKDDYYEFGAEYAQDKFSFKL